MDKRDEYFRCRGCKKLFRHNDPNVTYDEIHGYQHCEVSFQQPQYEGPFQAD